jgi:ElaB/YqjD/DUF883 family membrane-anchored ribosome-binding protein
MAKENVTDDLRAELKTLADTLEEVLNSSADKSKEEMGKLRSKAESALKESRARLGETSDAILRQTRETAARADDYVRENPWTGWNWRRRRAGAGCPADASLIMANTQHTQGPGSAFSPSASASSRCWSKWWKRGCAWSSWSWRRRKPTSSSC